ncbi:MAG TPA: hypothetical protein VFI31_00770 [Pirellulales bacterium]|nr:hypothetical protein [Pirellulales bacterium]
MKLSTWGAPTATLIARSIALVAFLFICGCTVSDEPPPNVNRRRVDVKVNIDLNRRPCPDGRCPLRNAGCNCGCSGACDCPQCSVTRRQGDKGTRGRALHDVHGDCGCGGECGCSKCNQTRGQGDKVTRGRTESRDSVSPCLPLSLSPCLTAAQVGAEHPTMNLPLEARCKNYGGGSCVCASTISLLRWQGRDDLAAALRNTCAGGQSAASLHAKLERLGVYYAATTSGDVAFLEWAVRTRRGCGLTFYPMHYVNLVDLTDDQATLLDNNRVGQYITLPRDEFVRRWRGYGGWATAVVYSPAAPLAHAQ